MLNGMFGTACGVDNVDGTILRVTNAIRDAVRPDVTMFVECDNDLMDEKPIVRVTVQRGTARPYYLHGKGIRPEGVFVRQGASTVPATDAAILNMTEAEKELCRQAISDYKKIRPIVQFGDLYRLDSPYDDNGIASLMYCSDDKQKAVFYWW